MKKDMEELLIAILQQIPKENRVFVLQEFIQENGAISDKNGEIIRKLVLR